VLVVYESMFGNTELIAHAIADGLSVGANVEAAEVNAAPKSVCDVDLLVVGGPTHAFNMSRPSTRSDARAGSRVPMSRTVPRSASASGSIDSRSSRRPDSSRSTLASADLAYRDPQHGQPTVSYAPAGSHV
jgi:hypothetical protein